MQKFTKKLTQDELEVAVRLIRGIYGRFYCQDAKELADLVSNEFDCNCLEEEVEKFVEILIPEELDIISLHKNIFN